MKGDTTASGENAAAMAVDPVCGMTLTVKVKVKVKLDTRTESFGNKHFHFCSERCQTKFKADPWFYASGKAPPKVTPWPPPRGTLVRCTRKSCAMHRVSVRSAA